MSDPRIHKLARVLVEYGCEVQPKDRVVIRAGTAAAPLIEAVYEQVLKAGGYPDVMLSTPNMDEIFLKTANADQLTYISPAQQHYYENYECLMALGGALNTRRLSAIPTERQVARRQAMRPLSETYMRRSAAGELKWTLTEFPTISLAQDADMSLRDYENFVYKACHVAGDDDPVEYWQGVKKEQDRLVEWLKGKDQVEVRGPNVDLTLSIKGRTFINACGQRNMPDGEIFTGPVEESVNGWVQFTYPAVAYGREVEGARIRFVDGKAVEVSAKKNEDFLRQQLSQDAGASFLGEFAIGTNFGIDQFTKNILFDEKIGGSIHMAFGASYPETGGKNESALHWDMICDMRDGSEIIVDGELLYKNGAFMI